MTETKQYEPQITFLENMNKEKHTREQLIRENKLHTVTRTLRRF